MARTQMAMKLMNRVFNKTGDVDSMDANERRIYDRMLRMSNPAPSSVTGEAVPPQAPETAQVPGEGDKQHRRHRRHHHHHHRHRKEKKAQTPTPAAVAAPPQGDDSREPTVEELKQMVQRGEHLTLAQKRRIFGG